MLEYAIVQNHIGPSDDLSVNELENEERFQRQKTTVREEDYTLSLADKATCTFKMPSIHPRVTFAHGS